MKTPADRRPPSQDHYGRLGIVLSALALVVAVLGFLRDLLDWHFPWPSLAGWILFVGLAIGGLFLVLRFHEPARTWLGSRLRDSWAAFIVVGLLVALLVVLWIRVRSLDSLLSEQGSELTAARSTLTAQAASVAELNATLEAHPPTIHVFCATPEVQTVSVNSSKYPFAETGVHIDAGDEVQITVQGEDAIWHCSHYVGDDEEADIVSAEGVPGEKSDAFLVPPANLCELVGQIANGSFFRVGVHEQFTAKESGMLKLGANDDPSCSWDCYAENVGSLTVLISVTKQEKTE